MAKNFTGGTVLDKAAVWKLSLKKLAASGLYEKDAVELKMSAATAAETAAFWKGGHPALRIPYLDPFTGVPMLDGLDPPGPFSRVRCLTEPLPTLFPDKDGKERRFPKYTQVKDGLVHAYFPPSIEWHDLLLDPKRPLIITEGELKAACATKRGFPTIGLAGVWCFMSRKHHYEFLPELQRIVWESRDVYVAYDSDITEKPDVRHAMEALTARLVDRGATVLRIDLPQPGADKVGLDDYLVGHKDEAFRKLIAEATRLESWQHAYQSTDAGPINNLANVMIALKHAPELVDVFAFDQMAMATSVVKPLFDDGANDFRRRLQTDHDAVLVQAWLQGYGGLARIGPSDVFSGIDASAHQRPFHPVRDALRSVTWDKKPRLTGWLTRYFEVEKSEYADAMGRMVLIAMVARVEKPGCKCDYMMVLVDPKQGEGKSTALSVLAGEEHFSDQLPKLDGNDEKRLSQHLRGKWLIEVAELSAMRKAEVEEIKKFVTRQTEKFTPMFGRKEVAEPRQCVLIGTTNEERFLKDETGNRRFWPVRSGRIDLDGLRADRDQLFAEAFTAYQAGEKWYPTADMETRLFAPEQDKHFDGGEWDEFVDDYVRKQMQIAAMDPLVLATFSISTNEIAESGINIDRKNINSGTGQKISAALKRLEWIARRSNGRRRFHPPQSLVDEIRGLSPDTTNVVEMKAVKKKPGRPKKY